MEAIRNVLRKPLTKHLCCEWSHHCCHIHVIQKSVKEEMATYGKKAFFEQIDKELDEALKKIAIEMPRHPFAKGVFAVSPVLKMKSLQNMFKNKGFTVEQTENKIFLDMFKGQKVCQAWLSRPELLEIHH